MKTIKYILFLFVIFILNSNSYAATPVAKEAMITLEKQLQKNFYPNGSTSVSTTVDYHFGTYLPGSNQTKICYRTVWSFTLPTDIPAGAYASITKINFNCNTGNYFKLGVVNGYSAGTAESVWGQTENADIIATMSGSSGKNDSINITNLLDYVRNAYDNSQPKIYLLLKSYSEDLNTNLAVINGRFSVTITYLIQPLYTLENNYGMGNLFIDNEIKSSGFSKRFNDQSSHTFAAIEPQTTSTYTYIWNDTEAPNNRSNWELRRFGGDISTLSSNQSISHQTIGDEHKSTIIADMKKICNIVFRNSKGKPVVVNGTSYSTPTTAFPVVELNPIPASAANYTENNINFVFQKFTDINRQEVTSPFNPTSHNTYTAQYRGYPLNTNRNLTSPSPAGQAVTITWNEHPSPDVTQYQIWRRIALHSTGSQYGPEELIATVNRGTCTYTDGTQCKATGRYDVLLQYDVRAYYAPDQTTSSTSYLTVWGVFWDPEKAAGNSDPTIPLKTELAGNFPNPFNPTTQIKFSLKEDGMVSLKVYNILGAEVETLINNEIITAGEHIYNFNGSDLPSGLYILTFNTRDYSESRKMMLLK